jgi:hypothetical protein
MGVQKGGRPGEVPNHLVCGGDEVSPVVTVQGIHGPLLGRRGRVHNGDLMAPYGPLYGPPQDPRPLNTLICPDITWGRNSTGALMHSDP